jgi:hypothetical protein
MMTEIDVDIYTINGIRIDQEWMIKHNIRYIGGEYSNVFGHERLIKFSDGRKDIRLRDNDEEFGKFLEQTNNEILN